MTLQDLFDHIDARAEMKKKVAQQDYNKGQEHCKHGNYDTWYRCHRSDDGLAYDLGWTHANETVKNDKVNYIDCNS